MKPNTLVRINYEKCTVVLRNSRLAALASSRIGSTTAQVYEAGLRLIEKNIPRCRLDPRIDDIKDLPDGPTFTTMELTAALSKSVRTGTGIGTVSSDKIDTRKLEKARKSRMGTDVSDVEGEASSDEDVLMDDIPIANGNGNGNIPEVDPDSDSHGDDPFDDEAPTTKSSKGAKVTFQDKLPKPEAAETRENRMLQVKNHLLLLAGDDCDFLRKCGSRGLGEWTVDFEGMTQYLQEVEMDTMILENFGKVGHRLARMMRKLGKLDEKQLPNLALVKQKDVRTKLAEMQMAGVVDIQEVPRDSGRTTSRTIFLWYFDVERVSTMLLDSIYKNMSRCFQRLDIERRRVQDVLALTERTDLLDEQPEQYMAQDQLNTLHEIEDKEDSLLGQIGRLDELVAIFRDY
jgi:DNA-directed RNA polymerase III subunit RPC3